jgi:hypothetical protein
MNEKEKLQMEINELLEGKEQLLIPSLEAHFHAIEKDDKNRFSKSDYLKWYAEASGKVPPVLPSFVNSGKNQSFIDNMIDKACNEKSMNENIYNDIAFDIIPSLLNIIDFARDGIVKAMVLLYGVIGVERSIDSFSEGSDTINVFRNESEKKLFEEVKTYNETI